MNSTSSYFSRWEYQNIALAAVAQCANLVRRLAQHGQAPARDVAICVNPLLVLNPASVADVYPRISEFSPGLRNLQDMFSNDQVRENSELIRYTLAMLLLRNKLDGNRSMQNRLHEGLQIIQPLQDLGIDDSDEEQWQERQKRTFEQLATLYQSTISTLSYRIQVQGEAENLRHEETANKIRALLLAGIRSAVLWYQLGGRRWRLIFYRKRVHETAGNIRRKLIAFV